MALPPILCVRNSVAFPEHPEYIEVLPAEHRIICSAVMKTDPLRYAPITLSYVDVLPGRIRTKLRPDSPEQDDFYRIDQGLIYWAHRTPDLEAAWTLISHEQLPDWFPAFRERARQQMNKSWSSAGDSAQ